MTNTYDSFALLETENMTTEALYIKKLELNIEKLEEKTKLLEEQINHHTYLPVYKHRPTRLDRMMLPINCNRITLNIDHDDSKLIDYKNSNFILSFCNHGEKLEFPFTMLKIKKLIINNLFSCKYEIGIENLPKYVEELEFHQISKIPNEIYLKKYIDMMFLYQSLNFPVLQTINITNSDLSFLTTDIIKLMTVKQIKIKNCYNLCIDSVDSVDSVIITELI
jgi:hypothetical protein